MGATYRCMGISHSLKDDKRRSFFCPLSPLANGFIENRTLQTGQDLLSRKSRTIILIFRTDGTMVYNSQQVK